MMYMQPLLLEYGLTGVRPERRGNASLTASPHGVYPLRGEDRWIAIGAETDEQWRRMHALLPSESAARFPAELSVEQRIGDASGPRQGDRRLVGGSRRRGPDDASAGSGRSGVHGERRARGDRGSAARVPATTSYSGSTAHWACRRSMLLRSDSTTSSLASRPAPSTAPRRRRFWRRGWAWMRTSWRS